MNSGENLMTYHHIEVVVQTNAKPSYFTGSMIRGAMGYALKKVTCVNPSYQCEGCFTTENCLYYKLYEEANSFRPYRFEIELGSGKFNFGLYLFNKAYEGLPYILSALHRALTQNGLTKQNHKFTDFQIMLNGHAIYADNNFDYLNVLPLTFEPKSHTPNVKIKLLTPLRIKRSNALLTNEVDVEDILRSIYQKEQELTTGQKVFKLNYTPRYETVLKLLSHKSLVRKSGRQNRRMNMDGIIGEMALYGLDKESYRLLKLGEITGVGKQTVMGLGQIEIEDLKTT